MKIFKIALAVAVIATSFTFNSCKKYEEGPAITLRSPEARIARTWEVEKYVDSDGTETAGDSDDPVYTFTKDNDLSITFGSQTANGNWALRNDDDTFNMTYTYVFNFDVDFTIIKLTTEEFWLEDSDGDKIYLREK